MDLALILIAASLHIEPGGINPEHFNQFNPGVAVERGDWTVGTYRNSIRHQTEFVAWQPLHTVVRPFVGVFTGYEYGHPMPNGGIAVGAKTGPTLTVMPYSKGVVASLSWRIN